MIYTHIAYAPAQCEKNLGCAYNNFMEILPNDNDWGCFIDHDAMFTTEDWYKQIDKIIHIHRKVGAFGVRTNRVGYRWQMIGNIDIDSNDLQYHRNIGKQLQKKYYSRISTGKVTDEFGYYRPSQFSGVVILIQKKIWKQIGGFKESGFIGVDDDLRSKLFKHKIAFAIMDGIYVYHWYRHDNPYESSKNTLNKIREEYENFIKKNDFCYDDIKLLHDNT